MAFGTSAFNQRKQHERGIGLEKLVASRISGGNSAYGRSKSDFYPTPPEVTQALLDFLYLPEDTIIWEPACGEGHMVSVLEKNGMIVKKSDIQTGEDFLKIPLKDCDWIITNPPFSIADKFIQRCHEHKKPFALLLKSQYWHAAKRFDLFYNITPAYILPLTWRPDFLFKERGNGSPLMDVMWCVWCDCVHEKPVYVPIRKPS